MEAEKDKLMKLFVCDLLECLSPFSLVCVEVNNMLIAVNWQQHLAAS